MIIYKPDNEPFMDIEVDDESYHFAEIMGRDDVTLYFSLPHFVDFPIGCYITYQARTYTLYSVDKMRMQHRRDYEYTITFESEAVELENYIFTLIHPSTSVWGWRPTQEGDFKFPLAANSGEHLRLIAQCMTYKTGVTWSVGTTVDGGTKLINYDTMSCLDALRQVADEFGTEYSIVNRTINLGKVEAFKDDQITLSYGKGNGLRPGVEKTVDSGAKAIGKVYVQGTERNIDRSKYGSSTLRLPSSFRAEPDPSNPGQTIMVDRFWWYDGTTVSDTQFEGAKKFSVPTSGSYVRFADSNAPLAEGALDLSEIYPHLECFVSSVEEEDAEKNWWNIYSSNFTAGASTTTAINYGDYLIANGEQMSIIFQDGALAGRQFGVDWATKDDPDHEGETIAYMKIIPDEQDGVKMPNSTGGFVPAYGNHFIVFNCYMPDEYISGAEMDMLRKALAYLWENMVPRFSIKGEVDPIWSASRWLNVGGHFVPGAYFRFVDPTWENEGVSIRISNVKTFINKPHMPIVEMASGITKQGVVTALKKMEAQRVATESSSYSGRSFTKRSFADAKETMEMLIAAGLEGFDAAISPIAVHTMQLLAGSESLQFEFIQSRTNPTVIEPPFVFNSTTKQMTYTACALQHMTLDITDIRSSTYARALSEYKIWDISSGTSAVLDDPTTPYYLYVKCDADNDGSAHLGGSFYLSASSIDMGPHTEGEEGATTNYYYFLAAIINAEREGERSIARLYGFTEILPGQITTEVIRGSSGTSWWDLSTNQLQIGPTTGANLSYSTGGGLRLRGALVVNSGGNTSTIGCWRGQYLPGNTYYPGDEVWYEYPSGSGLISTYRCISLATSGVTPTDTSRWQVIAKGIEGNGIDETTDAYWNEPVTDGQNHPTTPESNWVSTKPTPQAGMYIWKRSRTTYTNSSDVYYTYTAEYCASNGTNGSNGPWLNSRGNWSSSATYTGSSKSCDVVRYTDGKWYMALSTAGSIPAGTLPTNTSYWSAFEANFSNVATGLLLTTMAYVDNLYVKYLETSHTSSGYIKALNNYLMMVDKSGSVKLRVTGDDLPDLSGADDYENTSAVSVSASNGVASNTSSPAYVAQFAVTNNNAIVSLPDLAVSVSRQTGGYGMLTMKVEYIVDSTVVSALSVDNYALGNDSVVTGFTLPGTKLANLSTGNHRLYIRVYGATATSVLSRIYVDSGRMTITYGTECVQIGANGFRAAWDSTHYASFVKNSGDTYGTYTLLNGGYGVRVSATNGIQMTYNGGSSWFTVSVEYNSTLGKNILVLNTV